MTLENKCPVIEYCAAYFIVDSYVKDHGMECATPNYNGNCEHKEKAIYNKENPKVGTPEADKFLLAALEGL